MLHTMIPPHCITAMRSNEQKLANQTNVVVIGVKNTATMESSTAFHLFFVILFSSIFCFSVIKLIFKRLKENPIQINTKYLTWIRGKGLCGAFKYSGSFAFCNRYIYPLLVTPLCYVSFIPRKIIFNGHFRRFLFCMPLNTISIVVFDNTWVYVYVNFHTGKKFI